MARAVTKNEAVEETEKETKKRRGGGEGGGGGGKKIIRLPSKFSFTDFPLPRSFVPSGTVDDEGRPSISGELARSARYTQHELPKRYLGC